MKKLLVLFCGVFFIGAGASANEIRNVITDSVQLTVNGSSSITTRQASSYSVSGSNIEVSSSGALGGLAAGTAGNGVAIRLHMHSIVLTTQLWFEYDSNLPPPH